MQLTAVDGITVKPTCRADQRQALVARRADATALGRSDTRLQGEAATVSLDV